MYDNSSGPIEHFSWGKFIISGTEHSEKGTDRTGKGKDILLVGKKVYRWKERKGHSLSVDMVKSVLDKDIRILIIGNGVEGALYVPDEVVEFLLKSGIKKVIVEKTPKACEEYNNLYSKNKNVALLAHGTC